MRNGLVKAELGLAELLYPSYREGLAAIHRGDVRPFMHQDLRLALRPASRSEN